MDSLAVVQFNDGFGVGFQYSLPVFVPIFVLGLIIYCVKRFVRF